MLIQYNNMCIFFAFLFNSVEKVDVANLFPLPYMPYVLDCAGQSRILIICPGVPESMKLSRKFLEKNKVDRFFKTN